MDNNYCYGRKYDSSTVPVPGKDWTLITDAGIIADITDEAKWLGAGNTYTGSIVGLVNFNYYNDSNYQLQYQFMDGVLRRINYNTQPGTP